MSNKDSKGLNTGRGSRTMRRRNTKMIAGRPIVKFPGRNKIKRRGGAA